MYATFIDLYMILPDYFFYLQEIKVVFYFFQITLIVKTKPHTHTPKIGVSTVKRKMNLN